MGRVIILIIILAILPQFYYFIKNKRYRQINNGSKFFVKYEKKYDNRSDLYLTNTDGFNIFLSRRDHKNPKGIIQIVHGMGEHSGNYWDFANFLNENDYVVIANDIRGHGKSISENYPYGFMNNSYELIDDLRAVNSYIKNIYPDIPIYMFSHSMGTMLSRFYLRDYDNTIDKLVMTGTAPNNPFSGLGYFFANIITFYLGERRRALLLNQIVGVDFSENSWISYNEENISIKSKDPLRINIFMARFTATLIDINRKIGEIHKYKVKNPNLPILNAVGIDDVITKSDKGVRKSINELNKIGYYNIRNIVYENMRHEILNEVNHDIVYLDILNFFEEDK